MKKYLLDSHTLIWAIGNSKRLPKQVLEILQAGDTQVFVSAVSFWEIAIKHGKGKLNLENFQIQNMSDYSKKLGIRQTPLTPGEATLYSTFPFAETHKDPFDRMLICQCIANGYVLLSKDARMVRYKDNGLECIW